MAQFFFEISIGILTSVLKDSLSVAIDATQILETTGGNLTSTAHGVGQFLPDS
jgi:hypothetical protein